MEQGPTWRNSSDRKGRGKMLQGLEPLPAYSDLEDGVLSAGDLPLLLSSVEGNLPDKKGEGRHVCLRLPKAKGKKALPKVIILS